MFRTQLQVTSQPPELPAPRIWITGANTGWKARKRWQTLAENRWKWWVYRNGRCVSLHICMDYIGLLYILWHEWKADTEFGTGDEPVWPDNRSCIISSLVGGLEHFLVFHILGIIIGWSHQPVYHIIAFSPGPRSVATAATRRPNRKIRDSAMPTMPWLSPGMSRGCGGNQEAKRSMNDVDIGKKWILVDYSG